MPSKPPKPKHPGRRGLSLSTGGLTADEAIKRMFSLSPEQSRRIIAETSPKPKRGSK